MAGLRILVGSERGALQTVTTRIGANQQQWITRSARPRSRESPDGRHADTHRIDDRVARIASVEADLAADGRHADAISIVCDTADDSAQQMLAARVSWIAEAE